jgi:hypothetical protein
MAITPGGLLAMATTVITGMATMAIPMRWRHGAFLTFTHPTGREDPANDGHMIRTARRLTALMARMAGRQRATDNTRRSHRLRPSRPRRARIDRARLRPRT